MSFRVLTAVAVSILAASSAASAQAFRYAARSDRYEATVVTKMAREMNGQRMEDEVTQRQRLTVSLAPAAGDTMRIGVTLDTASVTARSGPQDVSGLIGLKVEGLVSPLGHVYSSRLASGDLGPAGAMIAGELAKFLPRMRRDLRPGLRWADTTVEEVQMLGIPIQRRTITTSVVGGDTAIAGERAIRIDRAAVVSFTGAATIQGQAIKLDGSSNASGQIFLSRAGRYLGSSQSDSVRTNFTAGANAFSVTQTQTTDVKLAR